jgi:hypothetical protein
MSMWKRVLEARSRERAKKRPRDGPWKRLDASHEVNLFACGGEEVLVVRKIWTQSVAGTICLPRWTVRDAPAGWVRRLAMAIAKPKAASSDRGPLSARVFSPWIKDHMRLWERLTEATYDDGSPRETSTLTVMPGDVSGLKVVLNERDLGLSLWATGPDIPECLDTLELLLGDEYPPWKGDKRLKLKKGDKR